MKQTKSLERERERKNQIFRISEAVVINYVVLYSVRGLEKLNSWPWTWTHQKFNTCIWTNEQTKKTATACLSLSISITYTLAGWQAKVFLTQFHLSLSLPLSPSLPLILARSLCVGLCSSCSQQNTNAHTHIRSAYVRILFIDHRNYHFLFKHIQFIYKYVYNVYIDNGALKAPNRVRWCTYLYI